MNHKPSSRLMLCVIAAVAGSQLQAAEQQVPLSQTVTVDSAVRHDRSAPLSELKRIMEDRRTNSPAPLKPPNYTYPNITDNPEHLDQSDRTVVGEMNESRQTFLGDPMPPTIISVDGIGQADAPGGGLPPDTNGDVGIDYFVQYINTDWAIYDKTNGALVGSVLEGNTFWAGFGGICETTNAGDPIVLFDKTANVWMFSQFTPFNGGTNSGTQCFAISDRQDITDPGTTFFRYAFEFEGSFNDYPHIGIWNDETGARSGYYYVTHDFDFSVNPPQFQQASFGVVERDAMIAGLPAQFVRITNTGAFGLSSFGALPPHLESVELPPAGMCAPFVHNRADLDAYLLWQLCVDWNDAAAASLTPAIQLAASAPFDNGVNRIPQPAPAPAGSELDEFSGNTMYRASARAYPDVSGLPVEMAINHVTNAGNGIAGVRWVHLSLPVTAPASGGPDDIFVDGFEEPVPVDALLDNPTIIDQGVYSPDDDYRWMGAISLDQSGNLGLAYSVSSTSTFPSVRYTGKLASDPAGVLREEANCVIGGGVQTFVDSSGRAGRWGDYSSMSIDPVDQCTFWTSVEYYAVTGTANWENRICSFRFPECGNPDFALRSDSPQQIDVCTVDPDPVIGIDVFAFAGFNSDVTLSGNGFQGTSGVTFADNPLTMFPASTTATLTDLENAGVNNMTVFILGDSVTPPISKSLEFNLVISNGTAGAANLLLPADAAVDVSTRPAFSWDPVADTLLYTIDIATDAGFTTIVETGTSTVSNYTAVTSLDASTQYFWRVTTSNNCGNGTVSGTFSFTTGVPGTCPAGTTANVVFTDDIEGDVSDWTLPPDPVGPGNTWTQSGTRVNSGVASFFAVDPTVSSDQYLVSPAITLPGAAESPITLSFWNFQNMEANTGAGTDACWDGGLLEISTDGGNNFVQIDGSLLLTDPYNGPITTNGASPISGLDAWCADDIVAASGDQETVSIVDLDQFAGQTVQFRFRLGSDGAVGDEGWYIDDVSVQGCPAD